MRTHALLAQAFASAVMPECAAHSSMLHVLNGKGCCLKLLQKRLVCYVVILFDMHFIDVFFPITFPLSQSFDDSIVKLYYCISCLFFF